MNEAVTFEAGIAWLLGLSEVDVDAVADAVLGRPGPFAELIKQVYTDNEDDEGDIEITTEEELVAWEAAVAGARATMMAAKVERETSARVAPDGDEQAPAAAEDRSGA